MFRLRLLWARSCRHALVSLVLCTAVAAVATMVLRAPDMATKAIRLQQVGRGLDRLKSVARAEPPELATSAPVKVGTAEQIELDAAPERWLVLFAVVVTTLASLRKTLTAFGANPGALLAGSAKALSVGLAAEQNSFRTRFAEQFADVTRALSERMVIVIDDLDRCRPEAILEVMEAVNFLTSSGNCFVIFGMDANKVQAALAIAFERISKELAEENPDAPDKELEARFQRRRYAVAYLHKLINIEIKVPTAKGFEAWKLLIDEAEGSGEAWPYQLASRAIPWLLPRLAVLAAGGLGVWMGMSWTSVAVPATPQPVNVIVAAPQAAPSAPEAAASAQVQMSSGPIKNIQLNGIPVMPDAGVWVPGQTSMANAWLSVGVTSAVVLLVLLWAWRTAARSRQEVADSEDFQEAIKIWSELIRVHDGTPRAVKRFGNKLRYLEMLQQGQERDDSLLDNFAKSLKAWHRRFYGEGEKIEFRSPDSTNHRIATPQLVALGALERVMGEKWLKELKSDLMDGTPWDKRIPELQRRPDGNLALGLIGKHKEKFNTDWPPSLKEVRVFARLLDGVRLSGEAEDLKMRPAAQASEQDGGGGSRFDINLTRPQAQPGSAS